MLEDHYAAYGRHHTRGIPRPGNALLHGLVYGGEYGHKMVVPYTGGSRYISNSIFEVSHWFDPCDLNSFERSRSRPRFKPWP